MQQDGVAVRLGLGDHGRTDRAAAARLVLDDERLAELSRNLVEHDARHGVIGVTRGECADDLYRPGGQASGSAAAAAATSTTPAIAMALHRPGRDIIRTSLGCADRRRAV